jgi:catechol 2,3-dioxygenase-like lactoylglutathione lyase family enzyme
MKSIAAALLRDAPSGRASLGHCLQGVQHFGVTVDDMDKSIEFYTEVLGGKLALSGDGFYGEVLHNTLFQKEDIDALSLGGAPKARAVPDIRDGRREALDVRFISFGNTCVELLHFRDARRDAHALNWGTPLPTSVGPANASHLSFHVKDDVDLNLFAKALEEECQRRGLTRVVCNRIIRVGSEAERRQADLRYYANKFWKDPNYYVEGYSDSNFGDFFGWSLFYCKGPNGEQLEFNQVTRKAKAHFKRAQREYNTAAGTHFAWPSSMGGPEARGIAEGAVEARATPSSGRLLEIAKAMFESVDAMSMGEFSRFYAADGVYQMGNAPAVVGTQDILAFVAGFRSKVARTQHRIKQVWELSNSVICGLEVTYTRHDNKVITLPCCGTLTFEGDKIREARIYIDLAPVLAA